MSRIDVTLNPYNAVGNGTNETSIIQSALNTQADEVFLPAGLTFGVTGLQLYAGQSLIIEGKILKLSGASPIVYLASGSSVIGGELDGNGVDSAGIVGVDCSNVTIKDVYMHNVLQKGICSYKTSGSPTNWKVYNNRLIDIKLQSITLEYTTNSRIINNNINTDNSEYSSSDLHHGIQFWGGDAQNLSDSISISHLVISGNIVKNAKGGIWGSLGKFINVFGNTVEDCTDCGIDFERCENFTCNSNIISNCANGNIAIAYGCKHGSVTGNTCSFTSGAGSTLYAYNSTTIALPPNQYITINGNSFKTYSGIAVNVQACNNKGLIDSIISNNVIGTSGTTEAIHIEECTKLSIIGNQIITNGSPIAIYLYGVQISTVSNNVISGNETNTTLTNGAAITLRYRSSTWPCRSIKVIGNIIDGHGFSVYDLCSSDPATSDCFISGNFLVNIYRPSSTAYTGVISNNVHTYSSNVAVSASTY